MIRCTQHTDTESYFLQREPMNTNEPKLYFEFITYESTGAMIKYDKYADCTNG